MPDVGSQVLEVALGLVFVYLVFSLVASALQELVSTVVGWRAKYLEQGLRQLLDGTTKDGTPLFDELAGHPRITELLSTSLLRRSRSLPSYVSARTFSLALLDTIAPPPDAAGTNAVGLPAAGPVDPGTAARPAERSTDRDPVARARAQVNALPPSDVKRKLAGIIDVAGDDITQVRTEIENWYDDAMNRVSGWYKRHSHVWLLVFGVIVVSAWNVDTIQVVDRLWNDKAARATVVAQADRTIKSGSTADLEQVAHDVGAVQALALPVGWTTGDATDPRAFPNSIDAMKILGLLLTAAAVSFGAPFWFDALSRLGRLRATGKPEGRAPGSSNP